MPMKAALMCVLCLAAGAASAPPGCSGDACNDDAALLQQPQSPESHLQSSGESHDDTSSDKPRGCAGRAGGAAWKFCDLQWPYIGNFLFRDLLLLQSNSSKSGLLPGLVHDFRFCLDVTTSCHFPKKVDPVYTTTLDITGDSIIADGLGNGIVAIKHVTKTGFTAVIHINDICGLLGVVTGLGSGSGPCDIKEELLQESQEASQQGATPREDPMSGVIPFSDKVCDFCDGCWDDFGKSKLTPKNIGSSPCVDEYLEYIQKYFFVNWIGKGEWVGKEKGKTYH